MTKLAEDVSQYLDRPDEELVSCVLIGELTAFAAIMRRYNQRLFRLARSFAANDADAMDVIQSAYINAFDRLSSLRDKGALSTWLCRIVRNEAMMRHRSSRRITYMAGADLENVVDLMSSRAEETPYSQVANEQLRTLLEQCIDELPVHFRTVFMLRAIEHCSVKDTAEALGINAATVKTRYHRARALIQKRIVQYSEETGVPIHEFAGKRCDLVVRRVCDAISLLRGPNSER